MLVGEVRWATTNAGASCKLSGGSMLSVGVTDASKKRQVLRAIRRKICASASTSGRRPKTRGERLAQSATVGEANQTPANTAAKGHVCRPQNQATPMATAPMTKAPDIRR